MGRHLSIAVGPAFRQAGRKAINQDFHGVGHPTSLAARRQGLAIALADGISSSAVSHVASAVCRQRVSGRLLLHLGGVVGAACGAARSQRHQLLAARADPAQRRTVTTKNVVTSAPSAPWSSRAAQRPPLPCRRCAHLPPARPKRWTQLTEDHRVRVSSTGKLPRPVRWAWTARSRSTTVTRCLAVGDVLMLATDGVYDIPGCLAIVQAAIAAGPDLDATAGSDRHRHRLRRGSTTI
jgi:serine/threonine protein phosphatase PrpC